LPDLLAACHAVAAPGAFVLLTAHSGAADAGALRAELAAAFEQSRGAVEAVPLQLTATSGATLPLGWAARLGA
jgi:hypothetical protein